MLEVVTAVRFVRAMTSGRTCPILFDCKRQSGTNVEVVTKLSASECGVHGIVREAVSALLAADLGLPVPEPLLVQLAEGFIESMPEAQSVAVRLLRQSLYPTFGTALLPPGFAVHSADRPLGRSLLSKAAEIFAFDALTLNADRRVENPNCLCNGTDFAVIDHEMTLQTDTLGSVLQPYPWRPGALHFLTSNRGEHLLYRGLKGEPINLDRLYAAWEAITTERLKAYREAIHVEWQATTQLVNDAVDYLVELQMHLNDAFSEVRRTLA